MCHVAFGNFLQIHGCITFLNFRILEAFLIQNRHNVDECEVMGIKITQALKIPVKMTDHGHDLNKSLERIKKNSHEP